MVARPTKVSLWCWEQCSWAAQRFCQGSFMGLETPNEHGLMGVVSQHRGLEAREISGSKSKDLGLSGLESGRSWLGHLWS